MTDKTKLLQKTPLHSWHTAHGAKMSPFAGWDMPISYSGIIDEHKHTREAASIFDICHMGELIFSGSGTKKALSTAISHNLENLPAGQCRYGFILTDNGGIIDDCVIYCLDTDRYMLVVNSSCLEKDKKVLLSRLPRAITMEDVSKKTAKIDLQGPKSCEILEKFFAKSLRELKYFYFRHELWQGINIILSRTGYTGELGYEMYLPWEKAEILWQAILQNNLVKPAGLGARDTLRLEAGLPLYGQDLDEDHNPKEAGYEKILTSTANYIGKNALGTCRQKLIGLALESRRSARHGDIVFLPDEKKVGQITSACLAPTLGHAVALACVDKNAAKENNYIIRSQRSDLPAKRVPLPFYSGTAREKL